MGIVHLSGRQWPSGQGVWRLRSVENHNPCLGATSRMPPPLSRAFRRTPRLMKDDRRDVWRWMETATATIIQTNQNPSCCFGRNGHKCNVTTLLGKSPNPSLHADKDGGFDALRLLTASRCGGVSVCGDAGCDGVKQLAVRAEAPQTVVLLLLTVNQTSRIFPCLPQFRLFFF